MSAVGESLSENAQGEIVESIAPGQAKADLRSPKTKWQNSLYLKECP
jgi:hypothetical protein